MSDERNALAELADRLDTRKSKDFIVRVDSYDVSLARRIIAELAKVQDEEAALFSMKYLNPDEARRIVRQREGNCILKCRAIAEESQRNRRGIAEEGANE